MIGISRIEYYLPHNTLSNEELEEIYNDWSSEKIYEKTGIKERHISDINETALDLAEQASLKLFETGAVEKDKIDFVLLVTQTPDYILPSSACILQSRLGLKRSVGAFDINLGCSGFVYGLAVSKGLIKAGIASNVLLVTSETYSKHINPKDRSTRTIFGDGAAATLVSDSGLGIGSFDLGTDGEGSQLLLVPAGGARMPKTSLTHIENNNNSQIRTDEDLFMDGTGIFEFSIREVPRSVERVLQKECLRLDDIDLFVFHQANQYMLEYLRKHMHIDEKKFYVSMSDTGNTVSASIPIALKRAMVDGIIKKNKKMIISGFGVGLSWASTLLFS